MSLLPIEKLNSAEARKLSSFLRSKKVPPGTLTLNQLKGYLLCICCAPDMLAPHFWLPPIFGSNDEMPEFQSEADFSFIELIMRLYNQINAEVLEGNPTLPNNCVLDKTTSNNFKAGSVLHEWSLGFDIGLTLTVDCWDDLPLEELNLEEEVESLWMLLSFFADEQRARAAKTQELETLPFDKMLEALRQQLPWLIKDYAKLGRAFYETRYEQDLQNSDTLQSQPVPGDTWPLLDKGIDGNFDDIDTNDLIDAAHNSSNPEEVVALANQALKQNPECIDALLLLANWDARNEKERINFLQQAVSAGEKALGAEYFEQHAGHFWGLHETRPYMTALCSLALTYKDGKHYSKSIALFEKALHLNPHDNQANRHFLISLYMEQQLLDKAEALLEEHSEDQSAFMRFSQVLLSYIRNGDSTHSRQLRKSANHYNKHVAKYLSGRQKMPKEMPGHYGIGDKNEAILYVIDNRDVWRKVMGAIPWLSK